MSLDNLISKYLDGELNQEEDILLRHYLAEDKEAKEDFDISVELYHAMQKDAQSIKAPVDVVNETEDRIMMQIINDSKANVLDLPKAKKSRFNYKYISAAAVILFMFAIGKISDYNIDYPAEYAQNGRDEYRSVDKNIEMNFLFEANSDLNGDALVMEVPQEQKIAIINKSDIAPVNQDFALVTIPFNSNSVIAQKLDLPEIAFKNIESNLDELNLYLETDENYNALSTSLLANKNYNEPKMPSILPKPISGGTMNYYDDMEYKLNSNNVNISFFAASDYYNSGFNKIANSAIMNYSLSISYLIEDNFDIGIEFGNLSYLSTKDVAYPVPVETGNQMIEVGSLPNYRNVIKTIHIDNELFWLSAFAEHNIIPSSDISWFNLSGRLGLGASNSGSIFYGRIRGKVELYDNLFFTLGTEMRYMYLNFGELLGGARWSRTGFLVYGLEYNLR